MELSHPRAHQYTWRVPSPPRVNVPPPKLNDSGEPDIRFDYGPDFQFESSGFDNHEFLKTVTFGDYRISSNVLDWKYEQRHKAQQILPFLFLGPITAARDHQFLRDRGITLLLAVRNTKLAHARLLGSKAAEDLGIQYATVDTAGNQELIAAFPHGINIINAHLSSVYQRNMNSFHPSAPGKVLVFCETGNERSAAMVIAYLMAMCSMDVIKAIQVVQTQRFAISCDDSLKVLLQTYDHMLTAKRDVMQSAQQYANIMGPNSDAIRKFQSSLEMSKKPSKRTLEATYDDEEMGMDDGEELSDRLRFEKRMGAAPFLDADSRENP